MVTAGLPNSSDGRVDLSALQPIQELMEMF